LADLAKKQLHGAELNQRKIRLGYAAKNTTLFIGDLDGTITSEMLREVFKPFGPIIEEDTFVKSGSMKYGFVRFGTRDDAEKAKSEMNRKMVGSRAIRIGWGYTMTFAYTYAHTRTFTDCEYLTTPSDPLSCRFVEPQQEIITFKDIVFVTASNNMSHQPFPSILRIVVIYFFVFVCCCDRCSIQSRSCKFLID